MYFLFACCCAVVSSSDYHISAQSLLANAVIGKLPDIQPNLSSSSGTGMTGNPTTAYVQPSSSSGSGSRTSSRHGHGLPSSQRHSSPPGTPLQQKHTRLTL